jgi:hypothetical protein
VDRQQRIQAQHAAFERLWREVYGQRRTVLTKEDVLDALALGVVGGRAAAAVLDKVLKARTV